MPNLEELNLAENSITSMSMLHSFPNIRILNLRANKISNLDGTPVLPLETLILDENQLGEEDGDKQLPKLEPLEVLNKLSLAGNPFADAKGDSIK